MARTKSPLKQVHVSIDQAAYKALDDFHWEKRIDTSVLLREIIESGIADLVGEVAPDED